MNASEPLVAPVKSSPRRKGVAIAVALVFAVAAVTVGVTMLAKSGKAEAKPTQTTPALTVTVAKPSKANWAETLTASGAVAPWQEAIIGSQIGGSPEYRETHPMPKVPADLAEHNCLQYTYYPYGDEWRFEDADGKQVRVKISGNVVSNNAETLRFLLASGQGIFLAPSFIVFEEVAAGRLVRVMPDYRAVEFTISAIYPNRSHLPTKVRLFIDLLAERFVEHRKWMT